MEIFSFIVKCLTVILGIYWIVQSTIKIKNKTYNWANIVICIGWTFIVIVNIIEIILKIKGGF